LSGRESKRRRRSRWVRVVTVIVVAIFILSVGVVLIQGNRSKVQKGTVSVAREEIYYEGVSGNSATVDSRYLINYALLVYNSSDTMTITDKTQANMTQIVADTGYKNVETNYDKTSGQIKISITNLVKGENYTIQVEFEAPHHNMFKNAPPTTTCTPKVGYNYNGPLQISISPFQIKNATALYETDVYAWFTTLATVKNMTGAKPFTKATPPAYESMWFTENATTSFGSHTANYTVKVASSGSTNAGNVLFRTWIESHYYTPFVMTGEPTFDGATGYFRNGGSGYFYQYEYAIT
jgi:hypothetical protein